MSFERFIGTKAVHLLQSNFYLVKAAAATAATATAVVIAVAVAVVMTVNGVTIIIVALLTYFQLPHPEAFLQHFSILIKSFLLSTESLSPLQYIHVYDSTIRIVVVYL